MTILLGLPGWHQQAGIEGGVHAMHSLWNIRMMEEVWEFLLIDARSAFGEINRTVMLWMIRHEWPLGAHFCCNCYQKHHALSWSVMEQKENQSSFQAKKE